MKKLLPIGTVVLLQESTKRLMIIGRVQKEVNSETVWDYAGCLYPEGIIGPEQTFLFNHEQIDRVYFIGYQDDEELKFSKYLQEL